MVPNSVGVVANPVAFDDGVGRPETDPELMFADAVGRPLTVPSSRGVVVDPVTF